jgi:hypothetical protein
MSTYKTVVTLNSEASINSYNVGCIIEKELTNILGSKDRFIDKGFIKERDYRFNSPEEIREATKEEIELYNAFRLVESHFKKLK